MSPTRHRPARWRQWPARQRCPSFPPGPGEAEDWRPGGLGENAVMISTTLGGDGCPDREPEMPPVLIRPPFRRSDLWRGLEFAPSGMRNPSPEVVAAHHAGTWFCPGYTLLTRPSHGSVR